MSDQEVNIKELKGEKLDLDKLEQDERVVQTVLADMDTKKTKSETPRDYWLFTTPEDAQGMQMVFVTFSSTYKEILLDALTKERSVKIVYKIPAKYGSFTVSTVELPNGDFATKEAKTAWKKGNKANNRALVLQSSVALYSSLLVAQKTPITKAQAEPAAVLKEITRLSEEFLKWVEKE